MVQLVLDLDSLFTNANDVDYILGSLDTNCVLGSDMGCDKHTVDSVDSNVGTGGETFNNDAFAVVEYLHLAILTFDEPNAGNVSEGEFFSIFESGNEVSISCESGECVETCSVDRAGNVFAIESERSNFPSFTGLEVDN